MGAVPSPVGQRDQTPDFPIGRSTPQHHQRRTPRSGSRMRGTAGSRKSGARARPLLLLSVVRLPRHAGIRARQMSSAAAAAARAARYRHRADGRSEARMTTGVAEIGQRHVTKQTTDVVCCPATVTKQTTHGAAARGGKLLPTNFPLFPSASGGKFLTIISLFSLSLFPIRGWPHCAALPKPRTRMRARILCLLLAADPPATSPADDATHGALGKRLRGSAYISRAIASDRHSLIILERVNIPPPPPPLAFLNTSTSRPLSYLSSSRRVRAGRTSPLPSSHPSLRLRPAPTTTTTTTTSSRGGAPKHPTRRRRRRRLPPDDCHLR
jgi:hypothetical protein